MPKRAEVTADQQVFLDRAAEAAAARDRAEQAYSEAIMAAVDAGLTQSEIGRAIGVSGEAVRQILIRRGYTRQPSGWIKPD